MPIYCAGSTKATITIASPNQKIHVDVPTTINEELSLFETYSHDTKQPINKIYNRTITKVELSSPGQTYNNGAIVNPIRNCPVPDIAGKKIISNFDDYYSDNSGVCSYKIYFNSGLVINGIFFHSDGRYTVACENECPEGFCKCEIPEYPGYCCLDCASTSANIRAITNELRGKNG